MLERATRRELEREAEEHITLGTLLRREREEPKRLAVEKVLAGSLTVGQKIEKIQAIDAEEDEQGVQRVLRAAAEQATRQRVSLVLHNIKLPQTPASYLAYLFRERGRLRQFGRKTHVLETRFMPPGARANPELQTFFVKHLQDWAGQLSQKLALVNEVGWLYLSKRRYNLVVLLKRLCERILAFDFVHLNYRERDLIGKMRRLESLLLALLYRPEYLDDIIGAVQIVYEKQGQGEQSAAVADLTNRILLPEITLPSLYNTILGLNMVAQRRYLSLPDLMRKGLGDVVSPDEFNCDPRVRKRMEEYIGTTVGAVKKLHEQLFEARRLNSYMRYDTQGQPDTTLLRTMYETAPTRGERSFDADQENILLFAIRFLRTFDQTFVHLLNGHVLLAGAGKGQIFSQGFFQLEFSKLRTLQERLEKGSFHFSNFPLKRFVQIKEGRLGAVGHETEVVQLIDDQVAILVDLGKTLSRVLSLKGLGVPSGDRTAPLEPIVLQGKPFTLPHAGARIQARSILNQRTVEQALSDAVSVCFSAGLYFRDRFIYLFLGRERKYAAELEAKMRTLENLLDSSALAELQTLYS